MILSFSFYILQISYQWFKPPPKSDCFWYDSVGPSYHKKLSTHVNKLCMRARYTTWSQLWSANGWLDTRCNANGVTWTAWLRSSRFFNFSKRLPPRKMCAKMSPSTLLVLARVIHVQSLVSPISQIALLHQFLWRYHYSIYKGFLPTFKWFWPLARVHAFFKNGHQTCKGVRILNPAKLRIAWAHLLFQL